MMLLDSNIFIAEAALEDGSSIPTAFRDDYCFSIVTRIEVLGFSRITAEEAERLGTLLDGGRELSLTESIVRKAIDLRQGRRMSLGDSIVAATALVHSLPLATRNYADFQRIPGLSLVST